MPANQIVFDTEYMSQQVKNLESARLTLEEAIRTLKQAGAHEGWRCPEVRNVRNRLDNIKSKLGRLNNGIGAAERALNNGIMRFIALEGSSVIQANSLSDNLREQHGFTGSNYGQNDQANLPVTYIPDNSGGIALVKSLLAWADKTGASNQAGLGKSGLSYLESLYNFYNGDKRGLTGAEDLFDLADKSAGLYTSFYKYLKDFYNGAGDTFSLTNQKITGGIGTAGSIFGLISSAFGVADKISSGGLGPAGITGEVLGAGENAINIWESVEKFIHTGESGSSFVKGEGLYSPLSLWSAFGKTVLASGSQMFKSIEKYSADGNWDLGDTGRTGIELGVSGLYAMANSLSFGGLSALGKATGFTPENISNDIENWADNLGKDIGNWFVDRGRSAANYITSDSGLYEAYNNAGSLGKTAIAVHAVVQTGIQSAVEGLGNWFQSLWS